MSDLIGKSLGKYQIVVRVGRGGMARVYKAYQSSLDRYVALKILHSYLAEQEDFVQRFEREATAVAKLRHPNIVQVYDYDVEEDRYYIVMEFVDGPTLKSEILEREKLRSNQFDHIFSIDEIATIFKALGSAIDYAHARGMIHRDLKPGNIMFTFDGQVLLTDFGLARMIYSDRQTKTGALSGTPAYMSPEQVEGKHIDERSDIYSLGVILYEMVTGHIPFEADTPYAIMSKHVTDPVPAPSEFNKNISQEFEELILKVLSKNPDDRFQSAGNLAASIMQAVGESSSLHVDEETFAPVATLADNQEMLSIATQAGGLTTQQAITISPYRGLYAFREADAPYFFGREDFTKRLKERLKEHLFVALIGPSGSGKSSVVFAGLLPELHSENNWLTIASRPGSRPFHSLADALISQLKPDLVEGEHLAETNSLSEALSTGKVSVLDIVHSLARKNEIRNHILLVVDQFEELYTLCRDETERQLYTTQLIDLAKECEETDELHLNIIITLRADFMGQALANRFMSDVLQDADVKLGPMTRAELGRAIESPAGKLGIVYEAGLVERILDDVGDEPGNLPLLEFALTLLWEQRQGRRLTHAAYESIGRVEGSLARYADQIYEELTLSEQDRAKRIFTQLVRPGEGTEDTRRVATRDDLSAEDWRLVRRLADNRLIVTSTALEGHETAEIVHEALIRGWGRLRGWMNSDRSFRTWQERMRVALHQWESSDQDEGILLRGVLLAEAKEWLADKQKDLSSSEIDFIVASIELEKWKAAEQELQRERELEQIRQLAKEQQRRAEAEYQRAEFQSRNTRRLRIFAVVLVVVFLAAVSAAIFAIGESQEAAEQADARETEVYVRMTAESEAVFSAEEAATSAAESAAERATAESERARANESADEAIVARDEAEQQKDRADEQANLALARQLAAQSFNLQGSQLDLALLLSLEANYLNDTSETRSSILSALQSSPALIAYLRGHEGLVQSISFSPDGSLLATAGTEGRVLIWDVETGEQIASLEGHDPTQLVNQAAFSPDGKLLASASDDQAIIIWDTETFRPVKALLGHSNWVQTIDFSPDGRFLASGGGDRFINIWDIESGERRKYLRAHTGPVWDLDYSPNGRLLASASGDGSAIIWDLELGQVVNQLTGHNAAVLAVAFNDIGTTVATGGADNNLRLWDISTGEQIGAPLSGHLAQVIDLAFSPDGRRLASTGIDSTVRLWDVASHEQLQLLGNHNASTSAVTFSPDGRILVSGDGSGVAIMWDVSPSGQSLGKVVSTGQGTANQIDYVPGGSVLAVAGGDSTIRFLDGSNGRQLASSIVHGRRVSEDITSLAFSDDGIHIASGSSNGTVMIWEIPSASLVVPAISAMPGGVSSLVFTPDDDYLVVGGRSGFLSVWDLENGLQVGPFIPGHSGIINDTVVSPDGGYLASAGDDGLIVLHNLEDLLAGQSIGNPINLPDGGSSPVITLAFTPDSSAFAAGFKDGSIVLIDTATGDPLNLALTGQSQDIVELDFNSEGDQLAVGSIDGLIRILSIPRLLLANEFRLERPGEPTNLVWNGSSLLTAFDGRGLVSWNQETGEIEQIDLPDRIVRSDLIEVTEEGTQLAFVSSETEIEIFDLSEGYSQPGNYHHVAIYLGNVSSVAYSPDGKLLASGGSDGAINFWDPKTGDPVGQPLLGHNSVILNLAFSPDGAKLASGSCQEFHEAGNCAVGEVIIWDVKTGTALTTYSELNGATQAISFSPDGRLLVLNDCESVEATSTCLEGAILVWDVEEEAPISKLIGHQGFIWTLAFSPDSKYLASGGADNSIILWDIETGQPIGQRMTNHGGPVRRVTFSPDGSLLASGGFDNVVRLWDVTTGQTIGGPLTAHTAAVQDVEFSPDGAILATAGLDGNVIYWDVDIKSWRHRACEIANRNLRIEEWQRFMSEIAFRETCTDIR